ncbi:MAG: hypothetical protein ACRD4E_08920 [Bryobacteraceae bacterium]
MGPPAHSRNETTKRKTETSDQRGEPAQPKAANEREHETRGQEMSEDIIDVEKVGREHPLPVERGQCQEPIQRIECARLHFSSEAASGKHIRVPERKNSASEIGRQKMKPGIGLIDWFGIRQKRKLMSQQNLPIEQNDRHKKQQ